MTEIGSQDLLFWFKNFSLFNNVYNCYEKVITEEMKYIGNIHGLDSFNEYIKEHKLTHLGVSFERIKNFFKKNNIICYLACSTTTRFKDKFLFIVERNPGRSVYVCKGYESDGKTCLYVTNQKYDFERGPYELYMIENQDNYFIITDPQ